MTLLKLKNSMAAQAAAHHVAQMAVARTVHIQHHKPESVPVPPPDTENIFVVKDGRGVAALRYWLQKRKYNTFIETQDKNGKKLFGLIWDYQLGRTPSKRSERGLVLVLDRALEKKVALILLNWMAAETDYGRQWVANERNTWKYGRE